MSEMNPNAKVSDEFIPELQKAFGGDAKAKDESERVQIKIKEIIEKGSKKKEDEEEEGCRWKHRHHQRNIRKWFREGGNLYRSCRGSSEGVKAAGGEDGCT